MGKKIKIELYDNYNNGNSATVVANLREAANPWITARQLKSAERRAHMIDDSCLRASRNLIDLGFDGVDVYGDDDRLIAVVRA